MTLLRIGIIPAVAALAGIVLTLALGNWQSGRAQDKLDLQRRLTEAAAIAPVVLTAAAAADPASLRYRQVRVAGHWQAEGVVYLENRPHAGQAGFHVLMPLRIDGGASSVVIVNRGWIPRNGRDRTAIAPYATPSEPVVIEGYVLENEPKLLELGEAPPGKLGGLWQNFDFDAWSRASGQMPLRLIVRQNAGAGGPAGLSADGLVRDWPEAGSALSEQIRKHQGYAFQWYSLAALLAGLALFFEIRKRRTRPTHSSDAPD